MYPKNSRFSGMYNDFEDDFYDRFDGGDTFYDDEEREVNIGGQYEEFLYSSDRDYGIYNMELADVASDTECTGLLARGRGEPDELSEYREMYNFGVADDDQ